jgi:transcriptional regulator with XRE-family HTH domain
MTIGANIRSLRLKRRYKQVELARLVGITRQAMHEIETDKSSTKIKTLCKIAATLEVTPAYLLRGIQ